VQKRLLFALPAIPILLVAGFWNPPATSTRYDSARWIDSGLEHESHSDFPAAEYDLLQAAEVDHLFQPRWTLAGFYFRRNDPEKFWHWTQAALKVGSRDLGALFDLCWKMPGAPEKIWSAAMPDSKLVWNEYLYYLMNTGKWPAAAFTAQRIAEVADLSDKASLMNYCDLAMAHEERISAGAVWQALRKHGLLPFAAGQILTNGDFRTAPSGRGFDWRTPTKNLTNSFTAGSIGFTLDGFQHEHELLLEQPLALDPKFQYQLDYEYKTTGFDTRPGLQWVAGTSRADIQPAPDWTPGKLEFGGSAASLSLIYQRQTGSTQAEGSIFFRNVGISTK
jgi:hypothetical protein